MARACEGIICIMYNIYLCACVCLCMCVCVCNARVCGVIDVGYPVFECTGRSRAQTFGNERDEGPLMGEGWGRGDRVE